MPVIGNMLLTGSRVWFEESVSEREFSSTCPSTNGGTGFVMSVPFVAPLLFDAIVSHDGGEGRPGLWVTAMTQSI